VTRAADAARPGPAVGEWAVRRLAGDAGDLHLRPLPEVVAREVWVLEPARPALVLGSTQPESLVDLDLAAGLGVDVVRRRSGGGVVFVGPDDPLWVDVLLPAGDPLWDDDVGRATHWLGAAWAAALADVGIGGTEVHTGALACGPLGRLVCFATIGAGEVTLGGRKVVGVSQRRARAGARFQCAAYRDWSPSPRYRLLRLDADGTRAVAESAAGTGIPHADLLAAFLRHLPPG
jgi:lipoate---protein ligase